VEQEVAPDVREAPPEVQREAEAPLEVGREAAPVAEEAQPPLPRVVLPEVEREVAPEVSEASEAPLRVGREAIAPPAPEAPAAEVEPQPPLGLEREVLARAESRAHLPLAEPLRPARGFEQEEEHVEAPEDLRKPPPATPTRPPTHMAMLRPPQARFADEGQVGVAQAWRPELPLPTTPQLPTGEMLQREALAISMDLAPPPRRVEVVQRAEMEMTPAAEPAEEEESGTDLDNLARQVYPLIKRMLAIERERRFSR
jgi:hypothetical protein